MTFTGVAATDSATVAAAINQLSGQDGGLIATVGATGIDLSSTSNTAAAVGVAYTAGAVNVGNESLATLGVNAAYDLTAATIATPSSYLNSADVSTVDDSNKVLVQIDAALQQLATSGAQLGAYQDRFQAAITGLNTDATNLTSARSSIQDTDYAQATSNLSKAQILQQASTAMVAQANMIPQNILSLLQKLP
jgi:flagellin